MVNSLLEIHGKPTKATDDSPFSFGIESPEKDPQSGDYFCRVTSPALGFRLDVYGVTREQAVRLALEMTTAKIASILSQGLKDDLAQGGGDSRRKAKDRVPGHV